MYVFTQGDAEVLNGTGNGFAIVNNEVWVALSGLKVDVFNCFVNTPIVNDFGTATTIDLSGTFTDDPIWITKGNDSVFVFESEPASVEFEGDFIKAFAEIDATTKEIIQYVELTIAFAHCYPIFDGEKIWFVTAATAGFGSNQDRQQLFYYDTTTDLFGGFGGITANKQFEPTRLAWTYDDYILVASLNENGIAKHSRSTSSYVSTTQVNRKPTGVLPLGDRTLLISSFNGMLSIFNAATDSYTNDYANTTPCSNLIDDPLYVYGISEGTGKMERITKIKTGAPLTHDVAIEQAGEENDFNIKELTNTTAFKQFELLPEHSVYNRFSPNNRTTIPKRFILMSDDRLFMLGMLVDTWNLSYTRNYELTVQGSAMIATGEQKYYGETD